MGELTSGDPLARPPGEEDPSAQPPAPADAEPPEEGKKGGLATGLVAAAVGLYAAYKALRWVVVWVWNLRGVDEVGPWFADHWLLVVLIVAGVGVGAGLLTRAVLPWVRRRLSSSGR